MSGKDISFCITYFKMIISLTLYKNRDKSRFTNDNLKLETRMKPKKAVKSKDSECIRTFEKRELQQPNINNERNHYLM